MITPEITVARLLDEHPELIEVLAGYHPHFKQLRNSLLRRVMAPRVTLAQAARIAGVSSDDLLATLRRAVGEVAADDAPASPPLPSPVARADAEPEQKPEALARVPEERRVRLDVREDIRRGQEPFAKIMAAVKALGPDEVLVMRTPFEPIPLYDILGKRGFAHWTDCHAADDWSVWFYRGAAGAAARREEDRGGAERPTRVVDVRGLEPPQPMVRILEELERLAPGERLEVLHERRPLFLYPQLDERGFAHETEELTPGLVRIVIRRGGSGR